MSNRDACGASRVAAVAAEKARLEMRRSGESQSIIVSGESGSGKTESQKVAPIERGYGSDYGIAVHPVVLLPRRRESATEAHSR